MASPAATVWMPSTVRSRGRRSVIRSATGTAPEAISSRAWRFIDRRLDQVLVDELFGAVQ
jgi:hypothetical protein